MLRIGQIVIMQSLSVIIPTYNEQSQLGATLASLRDANVHEVIVADGGSGDGTVAVAGNCSAKVVSAPRGRGSQLNAGASEASGDLLLFLHADTLLPPGFDQHVRRLLARPHVAAGAFRLRIGAPASAPANATGRAYRLLEAALNWRSVYRQMPYGDQAIFMSAATFNAMGGFAPVPVMEDFDLICRLRRRGRIAIAPAAVVTSARRWQQHGLWRTTLLNQCCIAAFRLGVDPSRIASWRQGCNGREDKSRPAISTLVGASEANEVNAPQ